nr:type II secretion system protein [Massilia sp. BSC265]
MVELIIVMVLVGILGAIAAGRFFDRRGYDADAFAEQSRAMLRYAQKLAVGQNRMVYVHFEDDRIALCYESDMPCAPGAQVHAPSSSVSGADGACGTSAWYCLTRPSGIEYSNSLPFYQISFDALGRPDNPSSKDEFAGFRFAITGDGTTRSVGVTLETGYVF